MESFAGAWQRNVEIDQGAVLTFHAVFSCMTLIASDIAKLRVQLVAEQNGIWTETSNAAYSPVLRKPNIMQTRLQFFENWMLSKLSRGNTYVLKVRDNRRVVVALYVLDPNRVRPMVADDGAVYYELQADNIAGIADKMLVPASEIIHDRFNCLFHPLVGLSPIYASGLAATQGIRIQNNSANFFGNASKPGGLLIAPGEIDQANADRLKSYWEENFTGKNAGKIAVLGDGLKYEGLTVDPVDAQLIEQLKWTAEVVCSTFHTPPYKIGVGDMPTYNNIQSLNVEYFSQALQYHILSIQVCLREGLGMKDGFGIHFDLDGLLLMDSATQMEVLDKARNTLTLDERRKRLNAPPMKIGGDTVYVQEQDHSIEAIAARDAILIDQSQNPVADPIVEPPANDDDTELQATRALLAMTKGLVNV